MSQSGKTAHSVNTNHVAHSLAYVRRSLQGNASAANASQGLRFAQESARLGVRFLDKYKESLARGPVPGSSFDTSSSADDELPKSFFLSCPALVTSKELTSDRAKATLAKLRTFIAEKVLPREREIQAQGYFGDAQERWKVCLHDCVDLQ